jgi:2'-5' RNA ligase
MANWFVALPVEVGPWFEQLVPPPAVRLFGPGDLHITVAFLGPVSEERALAAFELAREFALPASVVRLGPIELLGNARRPSAFSALLTEGRAEVERAMTEARPALWECAGARTDSRPALAHVTVARPQRKATPDQLKQAARWARALDLGAPVCRLDRIALYTWSEDRTLSLFRIYRELPLAAAHS